MFRNIFSRKPFSQKRTLVTYPPNPSEYEPITLDELLESNAKIIDMIRRNFSGSTEEWEGLYIPSIRMYAGYVHLLPASRKHHHKLKGGLLHHGLEVAFHCIRIFETKLFSLRVPPQQRRRVQDAWRLATFIAGLCHDIGKPASDVIVTSMEGGEKWNPYLSSLTDWIESKKITGYSIEWRNDNRHKRHENLSQVLLIDRIPEDVKRFISDAPAEDVMGHLMVSIGEGASGKIHEIVIEADQRSVEKDLKNNADIKQDGEPETFAVLIQSTLRWMLEQKIWAPNKPGGPLWCIDGHVFLIWPAASDAIIHQLQTDRVSGIPTNPDVFVDMMLSSGIAVPFENQDRSEQNRFWLFKPDILKGKDLVGLCLESYRIISNNPLPDTEGVIIGLGEETEQESGGGLNMAENVIPIKTKESTTVSAAVNTQTPEIDNSHDGSTTKTATGKQGRVEPANVSNNQKVKTAKKPVRPEGKPKPASAQDIASDVAKENMQKKTIDRLGNLRDVLLAIADDIRRGDIKEGEHFVIYKGSLSIKYPDAVNGYGFEPKTIMNKLSKSGVLVKDPIAPQKKVLEIPGFGMAGSGKALVLDKTLSEELLEYAGKTGVMENRKAVDKKTQGMKKKSIKTRPSKHYEGSRAKDKMKTPIGKTGNETHSDEQRASGISRPPDRERIETLKKAFSIIMERNPGINVENRAEKKYMKIKDIKQTRINEARIILNDKFIGRKLIDGERYLEVIS